MATKTTYLLGLLVGFTLLGPIVGLLLYLLLILTQRVLASASGQSDFNFLSTLESTGNGFWRLLPVAYLLGLVPALLTGAGICLLGARNSTMLSRRLTRSAIALLLGGLCTLIWFTTILGTWSQGQSILDIAQTFGSIGAIASALLALVWPREPHVRAI